MQNILKLRSCRGLGVPENIRIFRSYAVLKMTENNKSQAHVQSLDEQSVARAKECLRNMLFPSDKAMKIFTNFETTKKAIKILNKSDVVKLSRNTKNFSGFFEVRAKNSKKLASDSFRYKNFCK